MPHGIVGEDVDAGRDDEAEIEEHAQGRAADAGQRRALRRQDRQQQGRDAAGRSQLPAGSHQRTGACLRIAAGDQAIEDRGHDAACNQGITHQAATAVVGLAPRQHGDAAERDHRRPEHDGLDGLAQDDPAEQRHDQRRHAPEHRGANGRGHRQAERDEEGDEAGLEQPHDERAPAHHAQPGVGPHRQHDEPQRDGGERQAQHDELGRRHLLQHVFARGGGGRPQEDGREHGERRYQGQMRTPLVDLGAAGRRGM